MMKVDKNLCIGCSLCVNDCIVQDIELINNKANIKNDACFKCGHCIAICPKNAVSTDDYNMNEVKDYNNADFCIDPNNLLNFIKFRRSVRHFKKQDVEVEKLSKIIEAGRFTQTATNSQDVSYIVIKDHIQQLKEMSLKRLNDMGKYILSNLTPETMKFKKYAQMWVNMYEEFKLNPNSKDRLFFNAPAIILVISNNPINASLASSNMELMTNALGLGTFFSGFFTKAADNNKEIMEFLNLNENQKIVTCMVIGYPNVKYQRTTPRKNAQISWM